MAAPLDSPITAWLPAVADLHSRLRSDPPARIADIGCADGASTIALAQRYPKVRIDGFDLDERIIDQAWHNAHTCGLTDRVTFHVRDVSEPTLNGRYELCIAHQGLHNMHNLIGVLCTMCRLAGDSGAVIVMEQEIGETLATQAHASVTAVNGVPSFDALLRAAQAAGFTHVAQLPLAYRGRSIYRLYV